MITLQKPDGRLSEADEEDLGRVLDEVTEAMAGRAAILSSHPDEGQPAQIIRGSHGSAPWLEEIAHLVARGKLWPSPDPGNITCWTDCTIGNKNAVAFSVPVQRVSGYNRLVVTTFFGPLSQQAREHAEQVYLRRRPFAIGFFRLWQIARYRERQMLALEAALHLNEMGVILLDQTNRAVFTNAAADAILANGEGLCRRNNRIAARELSDSIKLNAAIEHIISSGSGAARQQAPLFRIRRRSGPPLVIAVLPNDQPATEPSDVAAILFVIDSSGTPEKMLQPICKLFRLSPLETRLACLLVTGATLQEAAGLLRVKEQTARGYLKQIFIKTETNRQADLVRTMLTSLVRTNRAIQAEVL